MSQFKSTRFLLIATAVAVGSTLFGVASPSPSGPSAAAQADDPCAGLGLNNPGFENGAVGGDPACWDVLQRNDRVRVVGAEGPAFSAVYAEQGITVTPPRGSSMLALGNPRQQGESQAKAPDTVAQTFTATGEAFELQFRVFSWEPDGNDIVEVSIDGPDAPEVSLALGTYTNGGCSGGTCTYSIDTGKRSDKLLLDTQWKNATFTGLTQGEDYTVEITIGGTKRTSFATWGYVDDVSSPPVALSLIHISEPTRRRDSSRMPSSA